MSEVAKIPSLREYQVENCKEVDIQLNGLIQYLLLIMPAGTGKTTVFSALGLKWYRQEKRLLFIVHRIELVYQIAARLKTFTLDSSIIGGNEKPDFTLRVQVGMVQSLKKEFDWTPDYIIIDECHHSQADSYSRLWDLYPKAKILGVTATPIRLDNLPFNNLYQKLINLHPVSYFIKNGFLAKPKHYVCTKPLTDIKIVNGEYDHVDLAKIMRDEKHIADVIDAYKRYTPGKRCIVFAVDVAHSKQLAQRFNEQGIPAGHIDGEMSKEARKAIIDKYTSGEILVLVNYDIVTEGFDVPLTEAVALTRRTKSLAFFIQATSRCLRPKSPTDAGYGYILDCCGCWLDHGPAGIDFPWDINVTAEEIEKVKRKKRVMRSFAKKEKEFFEIVGMDLNHLEEDLERLLIFESYVHQCVEKREPLTSAITMYKARLELMDIKFSEMDANYIQETLQDYGLSVTSMALV